MSRHILIISYRDIRHPEWGGAEVIIYEVFRRIHKEGHRVTFLCGNFPGGSTRDEAEGMEIHRTGNWWNFNFKVPAFLRSFAAREKVDIVVEDINKIPFFSPLFLKGIPTLGIVPHLFGTTVFQQVPWHMAAYVYLYEQFIPLVYRKCRFSVLSHSTKDDLISRGLSSERIHVIRSGLDHEAHRPPESRERLPEPVIVYLGRLKKYKCIDLPILALPQVLRTVPGAQYWIVGEGDHQEHLEELTRRMGLEDHVKFLGMRLGPEKLEILHRARILVYTSPKEGWGLSVVEANAAGCPVVASNSPGLRESVRHGSTGFLVPHGDVDGLAESMTKLLVEDELWREMSDEGVRWAGEFNWERSARETMDLIDLVLDSKEKPVGATARFAEKTTPGEATRDG